MLRIAFAALASISVAATGCGLLPWIGAGRAALLGDPAATSPSPSVDLIQPSASGFSGWWQIPTTAPSPPGRVAYQMAYDSEDRYVVLFGGCPVYAFEGLCGSAVLDDTWSYTNGTWTNLTSTVPLHPSARSAGVMADDPSAGGVILFGGQGPGFALRDTWEWTGGVWLRLAPSVSPPALTGAAMAFDSVDGALVLTGGAGGNSSNMSKETWTYQDGNWTNVTGAAGPAGWFQPAFAPDPTTGGALLFGGVTLGLAPTYTSQTWSFERGNWSNRTAASGPTTPGPRIGAAMAFDPSRNTTFLSGGSNGILTYFRDVWKYNSTGTWTSVPVTHEPDGSFFESTAAWDGTDGYLVVFGERVVSTSVGPPASPTVRNSTWALLTAVAPALVGPTATIAPGTTVSWEGSASGGLPPYTYNWSFGDGSTASGRATISHAYDAAGTFTVTLTVIDAVGQMAVLHSTVTVSQAATTWPLELVLVGSGVAVVLVVAAVVYLRRQRTRGRPTASMTGPAKEGITSERPADAAVPEEQGG